MSEKREVGKFKLKANEFSDAEIEALASKLKKGLKNKYGDGQVKATISDNKIKFKAKENEQLLASEWFS